MKNPNQENCKVGNCWESNEEHTALPPEAWCERCVSLVNERCQRIEGDVSRVAAEPSRFCELTKASSSMIEWVLRKVRLLESGSRSDDKKSLRYYIGSAILQAFEESYWRSRHTSDNPDDHLNYDPDVCWEAADRVVALLVENLTGRKCEARPGGGGIAISKYVIF